MNYDQPLVEFINEVLVTLWDPIGVHELGAPSDEYSAYVGAVATMLERGATEDAIALRLRQIEIDQMGSSAAQETRAREAAGFLCNHVDAFALASLRSALPISIPVGDLGKVLTRVNLRPLFAIESGAGLTSSLHSQINTGDGRLCLIDGTRCRDFESTYDALASELQLPEYFGRNLDALEECLRDLSWISCSWIVIHIDNAQDLLADEETPQESLLTLLLDVGVGWARPSTSGSTHSGADEWMPFNTVVSGTEQSIKRLQQVIQRAG
jgi:RNAse (barnase) inhibitor barstar